MAEQQQLSTRDTKLIQYLNEAYGKEKELETALAAHIKMANERASYKKRLQDHLKETKAQAKGLERRIKQLGGKAEAVSLPGPEMASEVASKATAAAAPNSRSSGCATTTRSRIRRVRCPCAR